MDCRKARELIPYAADSALDELMSARLSAHIASCRVCSALLESHRAAIHDIEDQLRSTTASISAPDGFAAMITSRADNEPRGIYERAALMWGRLAGVLWPSLVANRRAAAGAAWTAFLAATLLISIAAGRVLDSSPVASTRVYTGHLVVFKVNPQPDGNIVAEVDAHRYCRITKSTQEALW